MLQIRLFGELDLRLDDRPLAPLESARTRSLLAFLRLHHAAPQPRRRLAFVLWPDSTEGQARTNLRHLLHTLLRASPELARFVEVTPQTLRWREEEPCWDDVTAFEAALARADAAATHGADDDVFAALREAIDLYTGDQLQGVYDEWLVEDRERLRDRYTSALKRASGGLARRGDHAEAIRLGRELLRCDPIHEDTYRLLMDLHSAAGDRAGGVRVYHECVSTLQRELDVGPSEATTGAYTALMGSTLAPDEAEPAAPSAAGGSTLVGRDAEWAQLCDRWTEAERGRGQLVMVSGEPGIGKTRLVEELGAWISHRGAVVAHARSYATEGELGYGVVISWLQADAALAQVRRAAPSDLAVLARLLPELLDAAPAVAPEPLDEAEQRRRLFEAVARVLAALGRPTLLVADDAQWCDSQSLNLIHYLLRRDTAIPLLVIATVRREDLADEHPLAAVAGGLQSIDRAHEITLDRLSRDSSEELALRLGLGKLDAAALDGLYAETEGNPLFIVETVRALRAAPQGHRSPPNPKLQAVISARLRQLSPSARELVGVVASVGREFTVDVVSIASAMDDVVLVHGLDELWRRGIIREHGIGGYDFSHGKIRDVAYDGLSPATRRRNHLLIAEALLQVHHGEPGLVSGYVARHYDNAGRVEDAVHWYQVAAVEAQRLYANVEAVRLLDRAAELVAALPEGADRLERELQVVSALPTPLAVVEGFASTRLVEIQCRLLELAAAVGVEPRPAVLRSLVMSSLCHDDFEGARAVATRLQRAAEQAGDDVLLVETEYLLGIAAFWGGALQAARGHFERVVREFETARREEHLLRFGHDPKVVCLSRLANTLWFLGEADGARRARDEAIAMATEIGHPFSRGVVHVFAALLAVDLGEPARYREYVVALRWEAQDQPIRAAQDAYLGYADVLDGRTTDGIRRIRAAIEASPVNHAPSQRATHVRLLVAAHDVAGDAEGGLGAVDEALDLEGTRLWEAEHRRLRATFLAALGGAPAEVEAELARAADVARRQGAGGLLRRVEQSRSIAR